MENKNPDVTINVIVDVKGLTSDSTTSDPSKNTVKNYVELVDNLGDTDDVKGDSTTFDTKTYAKSKIVWKAQSTDGVDSVHMKGVTSDDGKSYFSEGPKIKDDGSEEWEATAIDNKDDNPIEFQYSIEFTVNGGSTKYILDPKLQIKKKE